MKQFINCAQFRQQNCRHPNIFIYNFLCLSYERKSNERTSKVKILFVLTALSSVYSAEPDLLTWSSQDQQQIQTRLFLLHKTAPTIRCSLHTDATLDKTVQLLLSNTAFMVLQLTQTHLQGRNCSDFTISSPAAEISAFLSHFVQRLKIRPASVYSQTGGRSAQQMWIQRRRPSGLLGWRSGLETHSGSSEQLEHLAAHSSSSQNPESVNDTHAQSVNTNRLFRLFFWLFFINQTFHMTVPTPVTVSPLCFTFTMFFQPSRQVWIHFHTLRKSTCPDMKAVK